ncbi:MAG: ribonuclease III [Acidimicrobiales bacterium]|nr:MAG: ribonuclease III [Acidimicrobiales bacterium]
MKRLARLEVAIAYKFKDQHLGLLSLTHSSYGDGRRKKANNEQLEFLGDRVLGLLTAEALYHMNFENEGGMARRLNALVRKEACASVARKIGLGPVLLISPSEVRSGGRDKTSILGDACEAVLAAIYIDGGYDEARRFFHTFWKERINKIADVSAKDPKTELQESASAAGYGAPEYSVQDRSGPDHDPSFKISVHVEGLGKAHGVGKSKKEAERKAAALILKQMGGNLEHAK